MYIHIYLKKKNKENKKKGIFRVDTPDALRFQEQRKKKKILFYFIFLVGGNDCYGSVCTW